MQQIYLNENNFLGEISALVDKYSSIVLFCGKTSFGKFRLSTEISKILGKKNFRKFCEIESNPSLESLVRAKQFISESRCDLLIALGGGSVIDTAKSAVFLCEEKIIDIIAIPTTCGTGSESTQFATYYKGKTKESFDSPKLLPKYVGLSSIFLESLPNKIMAESAADAICQAIESYWCVNSTEISKKLAKKAIVYIKENLANAIQNRDKKSLDGLILGANLAGRAINITRTTIAHAVSYPITSFYEVPHGQAVSVTLPYFVEYNSNIEKNDCADNRGHEYVKKTIHELCEMFGVSSAKHLKEFLISFFGKIGLETNLIKLINDKKNINLIVDNGFNPARAKNNPRIITRIQLKELLESIK